MAAETAQPATIEEIVVTARKQAESLQDVPVTVTAVSGAELARFGYDKPEDVASRIPALNVSCCGSGSGAQVSLRGVGSSYLSAAFDSAVALDFDGVVVSSMRVLQSGFFDVRQVEVLKGPQSLYFGKSASAGVLSFKSADPTDHWEYGGKASYEFERKGYTAEAYASGPLSDSLGFRLAAQYNDVSEVLHNSAPSVAHPDRGETNANVRATLQWNPTDAFTANLKLNYVHHTADGSIRYSVIGCGNNGLADPISLAGGAFLIPAGYNCDTSGDRYVLPDIAPPLAIKAPLGKDFNNGVPYSKSDIYFGRLKFDWNLSDQLTLSSVTGYLEQKAVDFDAFSYGGVLGGASFGTGAGLSYNNLRQFSQEARLSSSFSGPLNFMVGAFYENRHIEYNAAQNGINIAVLAGPDPVTGNTSDWFKEHRTHTDAVSAFGSLNYDITSQLKLSGGVRWTQEKKNQLISIPYQSIILSSAFGFAPSGFVADRIHYKDTNVSPEVSLSYQAASDLNFYAAYKKGYKSGGIDNSALPSNALIGLSSTNAALRAQTASALIYKAETAQGGEIGVKSQWFDRTLTLNASIYDYKFNDLQLQIFDGVAVQFRTTNAGELTSKGADLDFRWLTGVEGLSFSGALAYTDAKYTKSFVPDPGAAPLVDLKGRASSGAPKWSGNVAASYHAQVGSNYELNLSGNIQFKSSYYTRDGSLTDNKQGPSSTFDLAGSIGPEDGRWALALIGTNLADKRTVTSSVSRPFLPATGDDLILNLTEGRKVSVQASVKF
ncbi:MAG: TonB-dependent receptor [Phenylobacterium sp.]|uniref:TonB-dependent receptor n=1 Tax=Phenylobacterium sp. TaxID=1871053 RepID=UPI0027372EC9|nr:TonB-dependent receptor [Phenylobacterium sp.]MDP3747173.1 TonB-dependent receptor [Phenylobacterium sp.]